LIASSEIWKPQIDHFKDERRIIVFDLRGHGQSDKPQEKYSIKQFSEDLFSFMNNHKIEKAIIIGYSMGGMTALKFTLDHQKMVEKLILLDTTPKSSYSFGRRIIFLISQLAVSISYKSFMKYYISSVFRKDYPKKNLTKLCREFLQIQNTS